MTLLPKRKNTALTGAAGEHFVMYQLLRREFIAGMAPHNAPDVDILVSDRSGNALSTIQVKTAGDFVRVGWQMSIKHESIEHDHLFYCFVCPGEGNEPRPTCWIVPSKVVAEHVRVTHKAWLEDGRLRDIKRSDGDKRKMHLECRNPLHEQYSKGWMNPYREAWHLLGLRASS